MNNIRKKISGYHRKFQQAQHNTLLALIGHCSACNWSLLASLLLCLVFEFVRLLVVRRVMHPFPTSSCGASTLAVLAGGTPSTAHERELFVPVGNMTRRCKSTSHPDFWRLPVDISPVELQLPLRSDTLQFSYISTYYDNPRTALHHVNNLAALNDQESAYLLQQGGPTPPKLPLVFEAIFVDDGSTKLPFLADQALVQAVCISGIATTIVTLNEDVGFNNGGARNVGVYLAQTDWVLLSDLEHFLTSSGMGHLRAAWSGIVGQHRQGTPSHSSFYELERTSAEEPYPRAFSPNLLLMPMELFCEVGGYDETFSGLYGFDPNFMYRLKHWSKAAGRIRSVTRKEMKGPISEVRSYFSDAHSWGKHEDARAILLKKSKAMHKAKVEQGTVLDDVLQLKVPFSIWTSEEHC
jgi:hypothetical protein